jgi:hypothetical protein
MEKVQYGDVNRFLVSIGLILIILSLLLPFFYLQEDFGLYLEQETIDAFNPIVKESIEQKLNIVTEIQNNLLCVSIFILLLGTTFFVIGLLNWIKRQKKTDEKEDLETEKLRLEIDKLTPEERREKAEDEVTTNEYNEYKEEQKHVNSTQKEVKETVINNYLAVEEKLIQVFRNYKSKNFHIFDNVRIADRYPIDILLEAKERGFSDRIVEVKYANKYISKSVLDSAIKQLSQYSRFYTKFYSKNVVPVLLFVYSDKAEVKESDLELLRYRIRSFSDMSASKTMKRLQVYFIKESDIDKFDVKSILKK